MQKVDDLAYVAAVDKFVWKLGDTWDVANPMSEVAVRKVLAGRVGIKTAKKILADCLHPTFHAFGFYPGEPSALLDDKNRPVINQYRPPVLQAEQGPWPRISKVIDHLTGDDVEGRRWLLHWMARKVQNPALLPRVAVVFNTEQSGGKGFLARIFAEMLGPHNCAIIGRGVLESQFNSEWAGKLFVSAEEIVSTTGYKNIAEKLKTYIDTSIINLEAKHQNPFPVRNSAAWMFSSNNKVAPVILETGDRRYTVFSNFTKLSPDYRDMQLACFEPRDQHTYTESFAAEVRGFYEYCLSLSVDLPLVFKPYGNTSRLSLIKSTTEAPEAFVEQLTLANTIPAAIAKWGGYGTFTEQDELRDWANREFSQVMYLLYRCYCKSVGQHPHHKNHFISAITNLLPTWESYAKLQPNQASSAGPGADQRHAN